MTFAIQDTTNFSFCTGTVELRRSCAGPQGLKKIGWQGLISMSKTRVVACQIPFLECSKATNPVFFHIVGFDYVRHRDMWRVFLCDFL